MKDYYDIYFLANTYRFDTRRLHEALFETLQNRGTAYDANTINSVCNFFEDKDMQIKWKNFMTNSLQSELDFENVLLTIGVF